MSIDRKRQGEQVRNLVTKALGTIDYHTDGYAGEMDSYLVTLAEKGSYGETKDWWDAGLIETLEEAQHRMVTEATDAMVLERLLNTPTGSVEIPGLGISVPTYH